MLRYLQSFFVIFAIVFSSACVATGGRTTNGNATGGTVHNSVGDICLGKTANCTQRAKDSESTTSATTSSTGTTASTESEAAQ